MSEELYRKHRPQLLKHIYGQQTAVNQMKKWIAEKSTPHAVLAQGPSGCGKTTAARVLAAKLKCLEGDLKEINAASSRGIDDIRQIEHQMRYRPLGGDGSRVWIIDEAHKLTSDAQNGFLKPLEEPPDWVYIILCSSIPGKLIAAVRNRCTTLTFGLLDNDAMYATIARVIECEKADEKVSDIVVSKIIELAEGSARRGLVMLEQVITVEGEEEQLDILRANESEPTAKKLCQLLMKKGVVWKEVAKLLREIKDEPEALRHAVMGYCSAILLNGASHHQANLLISLFRDHWYDCGKNGLINACFEFIHARR